MKRKFNFGKIAFDGSAIARNTVIVEMEYKKEGNKKSFSVSVEVWNSNHSDIIAGGQCLDDIAPYINSPVYSEILRLWKLYHLNDMHPECEHQAALGWHKKASEKVTLYHWRLTSKALSEQKAAEKAALVALRAGETFKPTIKQSFFAGLKYLLVTYTEQVPKELSKYYEPKKPLYSGDTGHTEVKALGWLKPSEHPDGILCRPCPVCGYEYGSKWLYVPIPEDDEKIIHNLLEKGDLSNAENK